jgi:hypothetical protein
MWDDKKNNETSKRWKLTSPPLAFVKNQSMGDKIKKEQLTKRMNGWHDYGQMPRLTQKFLHCWNKI